MQPGEATSSTDNCTNNNGTDAEVDVTPSVSTGAIVLREPIDRSYLETFTALKKGQSVDACVKLAKTLWRKSSTYGIRSYGSCSHVSRFFQNSNLDQRPKVPSC